MDRIPTLIERLIRVSTTDTIANSDRIESLTLVLDQLMVEAQQVDFEFDESEYEEPPPSESAALRILVEDCFPEFGLYNCSIPVADCVGKSKQSTGDAIEDLVDVLSDLMEVTWCYQHTSEADALFHFQLGYRTHWGRHVRDLQLYIHDKYW